MSETDNNSQGQKPKISKLAIVSLILGLLSVLLSFYLPVELHFLVWHELLALNLIWFVPLSAVAIGIFALYRTHKNKLLLEGLYCAVAGITISGLVLLWSSLLMVPFIDRYLKSEVIEIENATKETRVVLLKKDAEGFVDHIFMYVSGYLEGTAVVLIQYDGYGYEYQVLSGKVCLKVKQEAYTQGTFLLEYKPIDVSSGSLVVRYCLD